MALRWPGTALVNGGECGSVRLAAPPGAAEDAVPDWLVVGMELRLAFPTGYEPGHAPDTTALAEEGFEGVGPADLTAAWARHLMAGLDEWQARGPQRVAERFLARLLDEAGTPELRRGIDPATGALVLERERNARAPRAAADAGRMTRLPRTLRLDPSDTVVFDRAAEPGEWAVPGGFAFWDEDPAALAGRRRQAFRAGFLGLGSFGWSTLVEVAEAAPGERAQAVEALAARILAEHGAPGPEAARARRPRRRSPSPNRSATTTRPARCWRSPARWRRAARCASASAPCTAAKARPPTAIACPCSASSRWKARTSRRNGPT